MSAVWRVASISCGHPEMKGETHGRKRDLVSLGLEDDFARRLAVSRVVFAEVSLLCPSRASDRADKALTFGSKRQDKVLAPHSPLADLFLS